MRWILLVAWMMFLPSTEEGDLPVMASTEEGDLPVMTSTEEGDLPVALV